MNHENSILTAGELAERLRAAGLRSTGPRRAVYQALADLGGHRSADEVALRLGTSGPGLPRASVYNALSTLASIGLVMQAETGSGTALFEVASEYHHHLLCRVCGVVIDVPAGAVDGLLDVDLPGAVVESAQVVYRGICADCHAAAGHHGATGS